MSVGGVRLSISVIYLPLFLVSVIPVLVSAGEWIYVGNAGYYSVYRVSHGVYVAFFNESVFNYEYKGLLVKEFYNLREQFNLIDPLSALRLAVGDHLESRVELLALDQHDAFNSLDDERAFRDSMKKLLSQRGVGAYVQVGLYKAVTNSTLISLLTIDVPQGSIPKVVVILGEVTGKVQNITGTKVDLVVVRETLWPPDATWRDLEEVVEELSKAWEAEDFEALRGIGSTLGVPLLLEVNGTILEMMGMSREEALNWISSKIPEEWRPVVFIVYYKDTFNPDIGGSDTRNPFKWLAVMIAILTAGILVWIRRLYT